MEKTIKIFKVAGWLDKKGFGKVIHEIDVVEKTNSFVSSGSRISKDKIMSIQTNFHEHHNCIRYFTYCKDGQQQDALDLLKKYIIKKVERYKSEIDELVKFI